MRRETCTSHTDDAGFLNDIPYVIFRKVIEAPLGADALYLLKEAVARDDYRLYVASHRRKTRLYSLDRSRNR